MKKLNNQIFLFLAIAALWLVDLAPETPWTPVFVGSAEAVVGRPLTPVSGAGVARRTTRRVVAAESTSASSQQQQQAAQQQAAPAPAPAPAGAPPSGTIITALPAGCESVVIDNANYFNCSGVYYQPTFQGNNLVYVVK
jgi:hypothetical protein